MERALSTLPEFITELQAAGQPGARMLSVYLTTPPAAVADKAYLFAFRDGCKALRKELPPAEADRFERAAALAEDYLTHKFVPHHPAVAVFVRDGATEAEAIPLPAPVADAVTWDKQAQIEPLETVLDDCERIAVLLFDKERARLYTVFLEAIEFQQTIQDELPRKQATGGWYALAQLRIARHHEDHILRHIRHTVAETMALLRSRPFDRLILGGPEEPVAMLRHRLPPPLRNRLAGTIDLGFYVSDAAVLEAARKIAEDIERSAEVQAIRELLDNATSTHVALGVNDTLEAISDQRVHRLFVADRATVQGGECRRCGRLVAGAETCPVCGDAVEPLISLLNRAIGRALASGARVEVVSGAAAELLAARGGLGAWTRY